MENLKQTIAEKKTHDGEARTETVLKERKFQIPKISWPAIFAGVLVATVSQMLFSLLGIGIGLATINPISEQNPVEGLGIGTILWWSVTMLLSLFAGGWTTGRVFASRLIPERTIHGLLTWCTFTVFSFFMVTTGIGMLISGTGNIIGSAMVSGTSAIRSSDVDLSGFINEAGNLLLQSDKKNQTVSGTDRPAETVTGAQSERSGDKTAGGRSSTNNAQLLLSTVESFFRSGDVNNQETREMLVNSLMAQTGMSRSEANNKVEKWSATYLEMKEKAKIKAEEAAKATSTASFVSFFALILGAFVTVLGARTAPIKEYHPAEAVMV